MGQGEFRVERDGLAVLGDGLGQLILVLVTESRAEVQVGMGGVRAKRHGNGIIPDRAA